MTELHPQQGCLLDADAGSQEAVSTDRASSILIGPG